MTTDTIVCPGCGAKNRIPTATSGHPRCGSCSQDLPWLVNADGHRLSAILASTTLPVLVDLWAPWCGPCLTIAPALEQIAAERAGRLRIVKVNVDEAPDVSTRFRVQGIPTMVLFDEGGHEVARQVGALPADRISHWIDGALGSARSTPASGKNRGPR